MTKQLKDVSAEFKPINQSHAIVETVFFCEIEPSLAQPVIERLLTLEDDEYLKVALPEFKTIHTFGIGMGFEYENEALTTCPKVIEPHKTGFERKKINESGTLDWMLRVTRDSITVHCLDYTRWREVWPDAKKIMLTVIDKMGASESIITSVGLKYIDRFVFEGDPEQYRIDQLFNPAARNLASQSFLSGPRWHCHTGWFDNLDKNIPGSDNVECLNQLNVDSAFGHIAGSGEPTHITTIEHTLALRGEALPFSDSSEKSATLDIIMTFLHNKNKNVLSNLLNESVKQRINLDYQED